MTAAEKRFTATIAAAAAEGYSASGVLSSTAPDRVGDTIDPKAYQPYVGKRLPALFSHDHEKIIGAWENLRLEGGKLIGDLKLAATELGQMVGELLKANVPLMNSIGFRGRGEPNKSTGGMHFKELDLLEASVVAVGCHPSAVMIAKNYGIEIQLSEPERLLTKAQKVALHRAAAAVAATEKHLQNSAV